MRGKWKRRLPPLPAAVSWSCGRGISPGIPALAHGKALAVQSSCRELQGGLEQRVPILLSSAMEQGSDRKPLRHWSKQAEREMLWGDQNLSPLGRGTLWQLESGRKADGTVGYCWELPWEGLLGQPGEASHGHREKQPSHPLCHSNHTLSSGRGSGRMV